jgi:hypothetical protein
VQDQRENVPGGEKQVVAEGGVRPGGRKGKNKAAKKGGEEGEGEKRDQKQ